MRCPQLLLDLLLSNIQHLLCPSLLLFLFFDTGVGLAKMFLSFSLLEDFLAHCPAGSDNFVIILYVLVAP